MSTAFWAAIRGNAHCVAKYGRREGSRFTTNTQNTGLKFQSHRPTSTPNWVRSSQCARQLLTAMHLIISKLFIRAYIAGKSLLMLNNANTEEKKYTAVQKPSNWWDIWESLDDGVNGSRDDWRRRIKLQKCVSQLNKDDKLYGLLLNSDKRKSMDKINGVWKKQIKRKISVEGNGKLFERFICMISTVTYDVECKKILFK